VQVWEPDYQLETSYLRQHTAQDRRKLENDPSPPALLTDPGVGYRFQPLTAEAASIAHQ
jgi:DNA-binding response OmpR family regulator